MFQAVNPEPLVEGVEYNASSLASFELIVTDVNEVPVFPQQIFLANVSEDAAVGTKVGNVTARDPEGLAVRYRAAWWAGLLARCKHNQREGWQGKEAARPGSRTRTMEQTSEAGSLALVQCARHMASGAMLSPCCRPQLRSGEGRRWEPHPPEVGGAMARPLV